MIKFSDSRGHVYESVIPDGRQWMSVTSLLKKFSESENFSDIADRCSINPNSKWYGLTGIEIKTIWENESKRAIELGKWYHNRMELGEINGIQCCPVQDEWKYAGNQVLQEGIWPEIMLYHPEYSICGQSDKVVVKQGFVRVTDYKSNKIIKNRSFQGKRLLEPLNHLEECDLVKYNLQLSIYLYMVLYHNPNLLPGKLTIKHVEFIQETENKWGYPQYKIDSNGDYIVKKVTEIVLPYMKKEVELILNYYKNNNGR